MAAGAALIAGATAAFGLRSATTIDYFLLDGTALGAVEIPPGPPVLAAFFSPGPLAEYISLIHHGSWTVVQAHDPSPTLREWAIYGAPEQVFAVDLKGDGTDDLVFFQGSALGIEQQPGMTGDCWFEFPVSARAGAIGDRDGDGREELAILDDRGKIWVLRD
jgi:hypothetical protein